MFLMEGRGMPLATGKLRRNSSKEEIQEAISSCIGVLIGEHPEWDRDRVVAACYADARRHAGIGRVPKE